MSLRGIKAMYTTKCRSDFHLESPQQKTLKVAKSRSCCSRKHCEQWETKSGNLAWSGRVEGWQAILFFSGVLFGRPAQVRPTLGITGTIYSLSTDDLFNNLFSNVFNNLFQNPTAWKFSSNPDTLVLMGKEQILFSFPRLPNGNRIA